MEVGRRLREVLTDVYIRNDSRRGSIIEPVMLNYGLNFEDSGMYSRFLVADVDTSKDNWDLPLLIKERAEAILSYAATFKEDNPNKTMLFPLYCNGYGINRRTFDSIIREMFKNTRIQQERINRIITPAGTVYYGGRGIILDKDFIPLVICSVKVKRVEDDEYSYKYTGCVCRVHPMVFDNTKDIVCKGIVNKIIPFFTGIGLGHSMTWERRPVEFVPLSDKMKVTVVVDESINDMVISPNRPRMTGGQSMTEKMYDCLEENIDEIMKLV